MDFGTGGLDLAYEVMRGYDALVLVDVSAPGRRARDALRDRARPRRDRAGDRGRRGDQPARHGPADRAALRQAPSAAGPARSWSSPASRRESRSSGSGSRRRSRRRSSGRSTLVDRDDRRAADRRGVRGLMHELSIASAVVDTVAQARRRAAGDRVSRCASGTCARSCRTRSRSTSGSSRATRSARARGWSRRSSPARLRCDGLRARVGARS